MDEMTDPDLSLARDCGATELSTLKGVVCAVEFRLDQLAAYTERIRQDERERILRVAKSRYDHEVAGAAHHAGRWHAAFEWHMTRQAAMSDMLDAIRSSGTSERPSSTGDEHHG